MTFQVSVSSEASTINAPIKAARPTVQLPVLYGISLRECFRRTERQNTS